MWKSLLRKLRYYINQVIGFKWLMSSTKGRIIRENASSIPGWNNFQSGYTYLIAELRIKRGPSSGNRRVAPKKERIRYYIPCTYKPNNLNRVLEQYHSLLTSVLHVPYWFLPKYILYMVRLIPDYSVSILFKKSYL